MVGEEGSDDDFREEGAERGERRGDESEEPVMMSSAESDFSIFLKEDGEDERGWKRNLMKFKN